MTSKIITLPDGRIAHLVEVDFDVVAETWNEYLLADSLRIRIKNIVTKIFLLVDDEGNSILDADGIPAVSIDGQIITASKRANGASS